MRSPSTIAIKQNGSDISDHVVFARTTFELAGSPTPGTATITLRDREQTLSFVVGDEITLEIDGSRLWGGLVMNRAMGLFFPVVDTSDIDAVATRMWILGCSDFNIYLDKRVIRNTSDYVNAIIVGPGKIGAVLRSSIPLYMDVPSGLDYTTKIEDTNLDWNSEGGPAPLGDQGKPWRTVLEMASNLGGFEYWIDADKRIHFHSIQNLVAPWMFSDRPRSANTIGFREGSIRDDGSQMVSDALVWGGTALNDEEAVFARYPDPPANTETVYGQVLTADTETDAIAQIAEFGRWQRGEMRIGEPHFFLLDDVKLRAYTIVAGDTGALQTTGIDSGLNKPLPQVTLSWFAHDVPSNQHLYPGQIMTMLFYALGSGPTAPLVRTLPLRRVSISFPTIPSTNPDNDPLTYVRFDGEFGVNYTDSRFLWRFLRNQQAAARATAGATAASGSPVATVDNDSTQTWTGAIYAGEPTPDGARVVYSIPFSYLVGTTQVFVNGLLQRPRFEYTESGPTYGEITFNTPLYPEDTVWITCRTGAQ